MSKYYTLFIAAFAIISAQSNDTLTIHPITFSTPSPEGWNAHYKLSYHSLIQMNNGQKFSWFKP